MERLLKKRYSCKKILGRGGMGIVHLGVDKITNEYVAIKECIPQNSNSIERIKREYNFMMNIQHPSIVKGKDFFEEQNKYFIVMEYVEGNSLQSIIETKAHNLNFYQQLQVMRDICSAVVALNKEGIIHRDLKPENIILQQNLIPKILDLGIAKCIKNKLSVLTQTGNIVGTPCYMAPEQIEDKNLSSNTDVFSLGIIFYQFLCWQKNSPFYAGGAIQTMDKICNSTVPPLTFALNKHDAKTTVISNLIKEALKKNPHERLESSEKMLEILDSIIATKNVRNSKKKKIHPIEEHDSKKGNIFGVYSFLILLLVLICSFIHIFNLGEDKRIAEKKYNKLFTINTSLKDEFEKLKKTISKSPNKQYSVVLKNIDTTRQLYNTYELPKIMFAIHKVTTLTLLEESNDKLLHALKVLYEQGCINKDFYWTKTAFKTIVDICVKKSGNEKFEKFLIDTILTYFPPMRTKDFLVLMKIFPNIKRQRLEEYIKILEKVNSSDNYKKNYVDKLITQIEKSNIVHCYKYFLIARICYVVEDDKKQHLDKYQKKFDYIQKSLKIFPNHPRYLFLNEAYKKSLSKLEEYEKEFTQTSYPYFFTKLRKDLKKKIRY